jgi:general nucleoside transport system permease protein
VPFGFVLGIVAALAVWLLYRSTVFGFQVRVLGDSASAARYAGIKTRRVLVAMMALSGALAGLGGASEVGDFRHVLDPRGLQQAGLGYAGIVVAALARYNPFAVAIVAVLIGGLANAGYSLQGPDFPAGLVGVLQGMILFFALGGELLLRYRVTFHTRRAAPPREPAVGATRP